MGDHKHEFCRSGQHKMEGHNVITRENGLRACRACQYARVAKHKREQRAPRLRWGKFSTEELETIQAALFDADMGPELYGEIQQYRESLTSVSKPKTALIPEGKRSKIGT